jgi:hypothetical protein
VAAQRYYLTHKQDFPATQARQRAGDVAVHHAFHHAGHAAGRHAADDPAVRGSARGDHGPGDGDRRGPADQAGPRRGSGADGGRLGEASPAQRRLDDQAQRRPRSTQQAATAPAATQPDGFASFSYLEQLAADVQKQLGVLPAVTSKSEQWLSSDDLGKLPGIGSAHRPSNGQSFPNYVLQSAEPLMPVPSKADESAVLSLLEPSQPLEDADGNVYLFRLTDAQPAQAPQGLADVRDQVEAD